MSRPCDGRSSNVCVAEGCYGEACVPKASRIVLLPWTKPPLSQNDRQHHHVKAKKVSLALAEACGAILNAHLSFMPGANITLHYRVPDRRRRDADNLGPTLKVCLDALVATGVLHDDSWACVPRATCQIHPPTHEGPAMWLELEEIP